MSDKEVIAIIHSVLGGGMHWLTVNMVITMVESHVKQHDLVGKKREVKPWEVHRMFSFLGSGRAYFPAFSKERTGTWWLVPLGGDLEK